MICGDLTGRNLFLGTNIIYERFVAFLLCVSDHIYFIWIELDNTRSIYQVINQAYSNMKM